jgi:hypothetical protein
MHSGGARCFYDGAFVDGYYEGTGTFTCCDGRQYNGDWAHGKRHGFGRLVMLPAFMQYALVRGSDGQLIITKADTGAVARLELGLGMRTKVYEGVFYKNRREVRDKAFLCGVA